MFGLTFSLAEKEQYFQVAESLKDLHKDVASETGVNAWEKVIGTLRGMLPDYDIVRASEGPGKTYFSGNFRALNDSTCLHCDWTPYDAATEDWIINQVSWLYPTVLPFATRAPL